MFGFFRKKDGLTFVCVTLNDRNDWNDHIALYNYGFSKLACVECDDSDYYLEIPCAGGDDESICVTGTKGKNVVVPFDKKAMLYEPHMPIISCMHLLKTEIL